MNSIAPQQHPFAPYNPDAIRGQFDTGTGVSCANFEVLASPLPAIHTQYPSLIQMTAAIDESDKQSVFTVPYGIGSLWLHLPSSSHGFLDIETYYSPALTSTLINEHDLLGITPKQRKEFRGITLR